MAVSKEKSYNPFDVEIEGVFGQFKTVDSYEVNYLLSNLTMDKLSILQTAAEAFDFSDIDFEEIMQRDVDYGRVSKDIVNGYLMESLDKAIFFPPIIVSVVALDDGEKPLKKYENISSKVKDKLFVKIWENDRFGIDLLLSENDLSHKIKHNDEQYSYYNYASTLKVNSRKVKLVVIDGQHRFVALQQLMKNNKDHIYKIELPVCFVFTPYAGNGASHEDVVANFREMFVTINTEAKKVGGHFTTLLKDKSLTSMVIRSLSNQWKNDNQCATKSFLQMLEWNERNDSKSNQRMRPYSITTVGILNDILSTHCFSRKSDCYQLLYLDSIKSELKTSDSSTAASSIGESDFDNDQKELILHQIKSYIVPALDYIYRNCAPYERLWSDYNEALKHVDDKISRNINGYKEFRDNVLAKFRRVNQLEDTSVETAQNSFDDLFQYPDSDEKYYFYNVFQHGIIRTWKDLSIRLCSKYEIVPTYVAVVLVSSINVYAFKIGPTLYDKERSFSRYTLYGNGNKPNVSKEGKNNWARIVAAGLINKSSIDAMREALDGKFDPHVIDEILEDIFSYCESEKKEYLLNLEEAIHKFTQKNWRFGPFDQDLVEELQSLELQLGSSSGAQERFDEIVNKLSKDHYIDSKNKLEAALNK